MYRETGMGREPPIELGPACKWWARAGPATFGRCYFLRERLTSRHELPLTTASWSRCTLPKLPLSN